MHCVGKAIYRQGVELIQLTVGRLSALSLERLSKNYSQYEFFELSTLAGQFLFVVLEADSGL